MVRKVNSHLSTPVVNYSSVRCRWSHCQRCSTEEEEDLISYQPTHRGRHQLHVKVGGVPIRGSPFDVVTFQNLGTPIKTIGGVNRPWGVAVNQRGEIIVAEQGGNCISIFSPSGEKIRTFGRKDYMHRESLIDHGVVAVDGRGSILVIFFFFFFFFFCILVYWK